MKGLPVFLVMKFDNFLEVPAMIYRRRRIRQGTFLTALFFIFSLWGMSAQAENGVSLSKGQAIYVPVYSHIYGGDREYRLYLAATLSIRNTDPAQPITVLEVNYFDSDGVLIKKYIDNPVRLNAMASTRYVVKASDKVGGSGANFIVKWAADRKVNPPVVEAVMIGTQMQQGISFTSRGQVIEEPSK